MRMKMRSAKVLNYQGYLWTEDETKEVCSKIWRKAVKYANAWDEKKKSDSEKNKKKVHDENEEYCQAYREKDWNTCRTMAGKMGRTNVGARRMRYMVCTTTDPTVREWVEGQGLTGPEGGCEAAVVKYLDKDEEYEQTGTQEVRGRVRGGTEEERERVGMMLSNKELDEAFRKSKNRRAVPKGRVVKEAWQMVNRSPGAGSKLLHDIVVEAHMEEAIPQCHVAVYSLLQGFY
jgi:hypothetical protein